MVIVGIGSTVILLVMLEVPSDAFNETPLEPVTTVVARENDALKAYCGMVTTPDCMVRVSPLVSVIVTPSGLRGKLVTMTVPVASWPPIVVKGRVSVETATTGAGLNVTVPDTVTPLKDADTGTAVAAVTEEVVAEKATLVAPAGTITDAGSVIRGLSEDKATVAPPACAGIERVTVPVVANPPSTGFTLTDETLTTGTIVKLVCLLVVPSVT